MRPSRASFSPGETYVACRKFICQGRRFAPGDLFDWRRMAVSPRRVRSMLESSHVIMPKHEWEAAKARRAGAAARTAAAAATAQTAAVDAPRAPAADPTLAPAAAPVGPFAAVHRGFGKWYVVGPDGRQVEGPLGKDDAGRRAADLNAAAAAGAVESTTAD